MKPLWKIPSGEFAGWRDQQDKLFNANGKNIGYCMGTVAFTLTGDYLGGIHEQEWIGKRHEVMYPLSNAVLPSDNIELSPLEAREGISLVGWSEPNL